MFWCTPFSSLEKACVIDDGAEQNVKSRTVNIIWFFRLFFLFIRSKRFAHSSREHLSPLCSQSRRAIAQKCFLPPLKDWNTAASKVNWALLRPRSSDTPAGFPPEDVAQLFAYYLRNGAEMLKEIAKATAIRRSSPMDNRVSFIAGPWKLENPWNE